MESDSDSLKIMTQKFDANLERMFDKSAVSAIGPLQNIGSLESVSYTTKNSLVSDLKNN